MAGTIVKTINGRRYAYEYFEDGKTVQKYCGPEGSRQTKIKSLEIEYQLLEKRQANITKKMIAIEKEIERVETKTENKE